MQINLLNIKIEKLLSTDYLRKYRINIRTLIERCTAYILAKYFKEDYSMTTFTLNIK